jgi:hypothetical protein
MAHDSTNANRRLLFFLEIDPIVRTMRVLRPVGAGREPTDTPT